MKLLDLFRIQNTANSKIRLAAIVAAVVVLMTLPSWGGGYAVFIVTLMGIYITLGMMWNLLAGYSGLVSLGLQMYIGVGAFALAALSNYYGVPLVIGLLLGGVVSMVIAVGLSYLLLRMRGMYFAIATWMFAEAMVLLLVNFEYFGRGQGLFVLAARSLSETEKYYFSIVMLLVVLLVVVLLLRSRLGLGLFAIRDNDVASQTSGVPLFKSKLIVMMVTGFITGVCGGVYYIAFVWIQPYSAFSITTWTVAAVFIVVIGGIGTITGPIVGGVIYVFLSQYLSTLTWMGSLNMVILGVIAVAVIIVAPKGIVGTLQHRFGFEIISARRWMKGYVTDRLPDHI
ncbi:MAG: branched-chain amino acid ABC transporter permease [Clostridiales bacterium]|nr:branched-chain amino acid ABC transporter permease [Clostridiales bacterium]